jgi:predicted RNA-binding Zn-ribbon protein involved in translation (DUF1610 family)
MTSAELETACPSCDAHRRLAAEDFGWILRAGPALGFSSRVNVAAGDGAVVLGEAVQAAVACGACGATIDDEAIEAAWGRRELTCACGHEVTLRAVPGPMDREGWWTAFVGESAASRVPPATKPVHFACPNCGGALVVDGTTRTPDCRHCSTRTYLPDDLWRSLRPTPKAEPFYLWVDPTWYQSWLTRRARQSRGVLLAVLAVLLGMAAAGAVAAATGILGAGEEGGQRPPWYLGALFSVTFSWMVAWAVGLLVARAMKPRRPVSLE